MVSGAKRLLLLILAVIICALAGGCNGSGGSSNSGTGSLSGSGK